jgi:hypothetical protein
MQTKLINYCKILLVCLVLVSCGKSKEDEKLFEELNLCLESSNQKIDKMSKDYLYRFEVDLKDPISKEKAAIWQPKAKKVEKLSNNLTDYIDSLQQQIKVGKPLEVNNIKIFYNNLANYEQEILQIDGVIKSELAMQIGFLTNESNDKTKITETAFNKNFKSSTPLLKLAAFKNRVLFIKEMIIELFSNKSIVQSCGITNFMQVIAVQNSTHLKPYDTLEITAGIGTFSRNLFPKVFVDDKEIKLEPDGVALYKTKVPSNAGKYKKKITIKFYNPYTEKEDSKEKEIIYTVDE